MSEFSNTNDVNESTSAARSIATQDIFSDVFTKLANLTSKSDKENQPVVVLSNGATILTELINLIEDHKVNLSLEIAISIESNFEPFKGALFNTKTDELFKNDSVFAYKIFYSYFDLLKLSGIQNYFKHDETHGKYVKILFQNFAIIILLVLSMAVSSCILTTADSKPPCDNCEIFSLMLNFLKTDITETSTSYTTVTNIILHFLWNYADKTVVVPNLIKAGYPEAVLKWLSIAGRHQDDPSRNYARLLSLFIQETEFEPEKSEADKAARPLISIVHNISRHDDGIAALNLLGAIDVIKEVQSWTKDSEINMLCCMILALLSTPEQIKNDRKRMNYALDVLLQKAFRASNSPEWKDSGFHISEPLVVLVKLFNDDRALDYILQHAQVPELEKLSTVEFFINLLLTFEKKVNTKKDPLKQLTCVALVNILWSVSFQEQYTPELKENEELMMLLEKFAAGNNMSASDAEYVPTYIENIQTSAKGIILNVTEQSKKSKAEGLLTVSDVSRRKSVVEALALQPIQTQQSLDDGKKPKIMISYSNKDKVLCSKLEEKLKDHFHLWIDKYYCTTGDAWEAIANGVEESDVVICLITKNYDSKSIRRELIYAIDDQEKQTIPIFVKEPILPKWLRIRTYNLRHVKVADDTRFNDTEISKLIQTIQKHLTQEANVDGTGIHVPLGVSRPLQAEFSHMRTTTTKYDEEDTSVLVNANEYSTKDFHQKPVDKWNKMDIKYWFEENKILPELSTMYQFEDGNDLYIFAKDLVEHEKEQQDTHINAFSKMFNGKVLFTHQFKRFTNALQQIVDKQENKSGPIKAIATTIDPIPPKKSQTCEIL